MSKFLLLKHLMTKGIDLTKIDYMKSYLKNKFDFMGVMTPHRKIALKEFYKDYNPNNRIENNQFIERLWNENEREYQHCALEIYFKYKKFWLPDDIYFIETLVVNKSWWDTVRN
jgi:3-methyladenine DNA glycosylase AlkD